MLVRKHPVIGERILTPIIRNRGVRAAIRGHHERFDGQGYPDGLAGQDIPILARLIALVDSFDAMTSVRPYRAPISLGSALSELVRLAPEKFDPNVVQGLLIQVRRDAVGSNRTPLLDTMSVNISATDIDQLAATLQHKISRGKVYLTKDAGS